MISHTGPGASFKGENTCIEVKVLITIHRHCEVAASQHFKVGLIMGWWRQTSNSLLWRKECVTVYNIMDARINLSDPTLKYN